MGEEEQHPAEVFRRGVNNRLYNPLAIERKKLFRCKLKGQKLTFKYIFDKMY